MPFFIQPINNMRHWTYQMARELGFEPRTYGLEGRCSIQLSYSRITFQDIAEDVFGKLKARHGDQRALGMILRRGNSVVLAL